MKKIFAIMLTIILAGCTNDMDLAKAKVTCQNNEGLHQFYAIIVTKDLHRRVICNDGTDKSYSYEEWNSIVGKDVAKYLTEK